MPPERLAARLDVAVWVLVYGGLFALILGIFTKGQAPRTGWSLVVAGGIAAVVGFILIPVRARLGSGTGAGAQSKSNGDKLTLETILQ